MGQQKNHNEESLAAGRLSSLYDVENKMAIDVVLNPYNTVERSQAVEHFNYCNSNDLIIFDRGYPSVELITELEKRGIKYLMRSKITHNNEIKKINASNDVDVLMSFKNLSTKVRLLKIPLGNETEILLTNLYDSDLYPNSIFKELYYKRWQIETNYDILKNILEIGNFSSYSEESIMQDIYTDNL